MKRRSKYSRSKCKADPENRNLAYYRVQYSNFMDDINLFQVENPDYPLDKITKLKSSSKAQVAAKEQNFSRSTRSKKTISRVQRIRKTDNRKETQQTLQEIYSEIDKSPYLAEVTKQRSKDYYQNKFANLKGKEGLEKAKKSLQKLKSPEAEKLMQEI